MLKCPVCGCTAFPNQDTSADFHCPVIGCDGIVEVNLRPDAVRIWSRPENANLSWVTKSKGSPRRGSEGPSA